MSCASALGRVQGLGMGLARRAPAQGSRPSRRLVVSAAYGDDYAAEMKAILAESLKDTKRVGGIDLYPTAPAAPVAAPFEAPQPAGPVPDLPGTEILPAVVPSPAAPVLEAPVEAAPAPAPAAALEAAAAAQEEAAKAAAAAASQLTGAVDSLGSSASAAASQASEAASQAAGAVAGAVTGATSALSEGVGSAASAMGQGVGSASKAVGAAAGAAAGAAGRVAAVFEEESAIIKSNIDSAVGAVQSGVAAAEAAVNGAVTGALDALPTPLKDALAAASSATAEAATRAAANPQSAAVAAGLVVGLPLILYWQSAFGGYSGALEPQEALAVLQGQDALLVDVRSEAQRLQSGIPELRRGALGKGAGVPPVQLLPSLARRVRNADGLALEMQATGIVGLSKVNSSTKIIIMDNQGERAKTVARAVAAAGGRAYIVKGGFRAWQASGLKVLEKSADYDASLADALADEVEVLAEVTSSQLQKLKDPFTAATVLGAAATLGYAALNFHTVLQFIGVVGLEATLIAKLSSYESPEAALEDFVSTIEKLSGAASGAAALLPAAGAGGGAPAAAAQQGGEAAAAQPPAAAAAAAAAPQQQRGETAAANSQPVA